MTTCKRCGCTGVRWAKTQAGKWYLALDAGLQDSREAMRYAAVAGKRPHVCTSHPRNCGGKCRLDAHRVRMAQIEREMVEEATAVLSSSHFLRDGHPGCDDSETFRCGHEECDGEPCSLVGARR